MLKEHLNNLVHKTLKPFGHEAAICNLENRFGPHGMRGTDFYGHQFPIVYRAALRNFFEFHKRLPDAKALPFAADHLFFSKFFRYFPTTPNAAGKLNAPEFLDQKRFSNKIYIPRRACVSNMPLSTKDLSLVLGWWLKLDLGNAAMVKVDPSIDKSGQKMLRALTKKWFRTQRYGWRWGEWWYSASPQHIFMEEDLTDRMPGDEYQLFMKWGRCVMIKKKRIFRSKNPASERTIASFYDHVGNHIPGKQYGSGSHDSLELSNHLDVMLEAATQIAAVFDHIRVDFILLHDAPALGELSYCTMNARIRYSTAELEALARQAVELDIVPQSEGRPSHEALESKLRQ
ncbi:ATP-grasp fold amidoligase family protein [Sulfitobacter mediterraneus]|uniref:ATP-grasp fold amidoligase family protein n=1 Tax=Sulfitobacter mediterraneus TaxID=83219 RepID=UPI0024905358|nr:ATP-grasp fold amidoligase family protein [Sulfitobacter mediterraneus]